MGAAGGRILEVLINFGPLPTPNELRLVLSDALPPTPLVTSALALAFAGEQLLMTKLIARGWDIPGGHIEARESPEQAMRREVYEETGAHLGPARVFAYQSVHLFAPKPAGYRYPYPVSYQVFYWARVTSLSSFEGSDETRGRGLFAPDEARQLTWVKKNQGLYEAALEIAANTSHAPQD